MACPSSIFREAGHGLWRERYETRRDGRGTRARLKEFKNPKIEESTSLDFDLLPTPSPFIYSARMRATLFLVGLLGCVEAKSPQATVTHKGQGRALLVFQPYSSLGFHPFLATNFVRISPSRDPWLLRVNTLYIPKSLQCSSTSRSVGSQLVVLSWAFSAMSCPRR